MKHRSITIN